MLESDGDGLELKTNTKPAGVELHKLDEEEYIMENSSELLELEAEAKEMMKDDVVNEEPELELGKVSAGMAEMNKELEQLGFEEIRLTPE